MKGTDKQLERARSQIRDRLTQLAPIFLKNKYMLGDDFSMLDVAIAPLLWRLDYYGIDMSKNAVPLLKYAERIFSRPAYIEALRAAKVEAMLAWARLMEEQQAVIFTFYGRSVLPIPSAMKNTSSRSQ